jgi:hypothetical protein
MNVMGRNLLRVAAIGAVAIAIPQLASAMGPTSAALKNQSVQTASDSTVTKCIPSEATCPKPRHRAKR